MGVSREDISDTHQTHGSGNHHPKAAASLSRGKPEGLLDLGNRFRAGVAALAPGDVGEAPIAADVTAAAAGAVGCVALGAIRIELILADAPHPAGLTSAAGGASRQIRFGDRTTSAAFNERHSFCLLYATISC